MVSLGKRTAEDFIAPEIKGLSRGGLEPNDLLALPESFELQGAMMAIRVVSAMPHEDVRRPMAATATLVGVVARGTEAAELARRHVARKLQVLPSFPNVLKPLLAYVSTNVVDCRKGWASFDVSIRLDAKSTPSGAACASMTARPRTSKLCLERAEVANVVPGPEPNP